MAERRRAARGERHDGRQRTALVSLLAAAVLVALKLGTGLATGSLALVSAGVESSGDVVAALLTMFAVGFGARAADPGHPYGHRRAENLAALGEAAIVALGGLVVTIEAVRRLAGDAPAEIDTRWYVFAVIGLALVIDVTRIRVSLRAARRYESAAFRSNAFNFAGDLAGSLAVLAGLVLVSAGVPAGDAVAALVVAGLIFAAVGRLVAENVGALMDRAPAGARDRAEQAVAALGPDVELRRLRLRESGGRYFADVTVGLPPAAAVVEGHEAADRVESALGDALPGSDVVVHVEPRERGVTLRDRVLAAALADSQVHEAHDIAIFEHGDRASVALHLKLADTLSLEEAHRAAGRVEAAIGALPGVELVQTHLEPLERPLASAPVDRRRDLAGRTRRVEALVRGHGAVRPEAVRFLDTDDGLVLFLTVGLPADVDLAAAHRVAGELEEAVRSDQPDLADVVVHTEPALS